MGDVMKRLFVFLLSMLTMFNLHRDIFAMDLDEVCFCETMNLSTNEFSEHGVRCFAADTTNMAGATNIFVDIPGCWIPSTNIVGKLLSGFTGASALFETYVIKRNGNIVQVQNWSAKSHATSTDVNGIIRVRINDVDKLSGSSFFMKYGIIDFAEIVVIAKIDDLLATSLDKDAWNNCTGGEAICFPKDHKLK